VTTSAADDDVARGRKPHPRTLTLWLRSSVEVSRILQGEVAGSKRSGWVVLTKRLGVMQELMVVMVVMVVWWCGGDCEWTDGMGG
jgi:hypothetical protein